MSRQQFQDECPGCRPVILELTTLAPLADDHPAMLALNRVWAATTREEREAFHRFTCLNSRDFTDLVLVGGLKRKIETAGNTS